MNANQTLPPPSVLRVRVSTAGLCRHGPLRVESRLAGSSPAVTNHRGVFFHVQKRLYYTHIFLYAQSVPILSVCGNRREATQYNIYILCRIHNVVNYRTR